MALHIGVVGEGVCSARVARDAERVGASIAGAGAVLLCGGLRGVMEAASRGAVGAGGVVVGLLPGFRRRDASRWVTIPLYTASLGYELQIASVTAIVPMAPGAVLLVLLERFLKSESLVFFGQL